MGTINIRVPDDITEFIPTVDPDEDSIECAISEGMDLSDIAKSMMEQEAGVRDSADQMCLGWSRWRRYFAGTYERIRRLARQKGYLSEGLEYANTTAALKDRYKQKMRRLRRELIKASVDLEELRGNGITMLERQCKEMPDEARETWIERQEEKRPEKKAA